MTQYTECILIMLLEATRNDHRPSNLGGLRTSGGTSLRTDTTTSFAAKAWHLTQRGITNRGSKVRHLWDLRWHGENQAIAAACIAYHLSVCPLCGQSPCSQTHILCDCPGLTHDRAGLHLDFRILSGQLARGPCRAVGRAVTDLLFHHPHIQERGQLWTGLWTPDQRGLFAPHLRRCSLRDHCFLAPKVSAALFVFIFV